MKYKCKSCGRKSDKPGKCCGKPMKKEYKKKEEAE